MPLVDRDPDRLIGTVLGGRFVIKSCAAVDDAGARYEAWDDELTSSASVRTLHKVRPDDASLAKLVELLSEVSGLGLDGIAPLRAVGRTRAKDVYYATDPIEGEPLSERLRAGPLEPREAVRAIAGAGEILAACHAKGMVHGGLHPGAVILPAIGGATRISLVDFGLGPITKSGDAAVGGGPSASMPYQSPEQASDDPYDHRADVYSLGALLFAALTGRPPFAGSSVLEILAIQLRGEAPSLAKANPELEGSPLQAVIDQSMQVKADGRFDTVDAMVKALRLAGKQDASRTALDAAPTVRREKAASVAQMRAARKAAERSQATGPYRGDAARGGALYLTEERRSVWPYLLGGLVIVGGVLLLVFWDTIAETTAHAVVESTPQAVSEVRANEAAARLTASEAADAGAVEPARPEKRRAAEPEEAEELSDRAKALIREGNEALASGRFGTAVRRFKAAKREAPSTAVVARGLGVALERAGNRRAAATELRRYLELDPTANDAVIIRAKIASLEGE